LKTVRNNTRENRANKLYTSHHTKILIFLKSKLTISSIVKGQKKCILGAPKIRMPKLLKGIMPM